MATDVLNVYINKTSAFHDRWQALFAESSHEVRVFLHNTDVLIDADPAIDLVCFGMGKKHWALEIQRSAISDTYVSSRQSSLESDYCGLIWLLDVSACPHHLERVLTRDTDTTRMFFPEMQPPALAHLKRMASQATTGVIRVLLDSGCPTLWIAHVEGPSRLAIRVTPVKRTDLIRQLRTVALDPSHVMDWPNDSLNVTRFDSPITTVDYRPMQTKLSRGAASDMEIVVEVMEKVPFDILNSEVGWEEIGITMREVAGYAREAFDAWDAWLFRQRRFFRSRVTFGKHAGTKVCDLPVDYILWFGRTNGFNGSCKTESMCEVSRMCSGAYKRDVWQGNETGGSSDSGESGESGESEEPGEPDAAWHLWRLVRAYAESTSMSPLGAEPDAVARCATIRPLCEGCSGNGSCLEKYKSKYIAVGSCCHACAPVQCQRCSWQGPTRLLGICHTGCCASCSRRIEYAEYESARASRIRLAKLASARAARIARATAKAAEVMA